MNLIELNIPPGVLRVGTELQSAGRWYDTNLIRWVDGVMRPIGGWRVLTGGAGPAAFALVGKARGAHAWKTTANVPFLGIGTHSKLYVYNGSDVSDITPAALAAGVADTLSYLGYGIGSYGRGGYGTPRTVAGATTLATTWSLDNFGQIMLGVNSADGRLFEWLGNPAVVAAVVTASSGTLPTGNRAVLVTEERFCMLLGAGGDPRKVQWSNSEDYTAWLIAATTQAGDQILQTVGTLRTGIKVRKQNLLLTDIDAHVAEWVGPPLVYGFKRVGTGCGVIGAKAIEAADDAAYWMGAGSFYVYDGAVRQLDCSVQDYIFTNLNRAQAEKVYAVRTPEFTEITWFYPSASSLENDSYVTYNYDDGTWSIGSYARTCGVSRGVFTAQIYVGADGAMYEHEVGNQYSGATPYAETGPVEIGDGARVYNLTSIIPDERTAGQVEARFRARFYPNGPATNYGPYAMASPTSIRLSGRQISIRVEGDDAWRVGRFRFDHNVRGTR